MITHLCWSLARSYEQRKRVCCSSAVWCLLTFSAAASSTSRMKFDNVLAEVNGFGKFQIRMMLLLVIPRVTLPFHFLLNNFIASIPSHHCTLSSLDDGGTFGNLSQQEKLVVSIPFQEDGSPSSCQMFAEPQYHLLFNSTNTTDLPAVPCRSGWTYDNTTFKSTLATEVCSLKTWFYDWGSALSYLTFLFWVFLSKWDLVCEKKSLNRATATIFFMGVMVGAAAFGYHSDRCGNPSHKTSASPLLWFILIYRQCTI